MGHFPPLGVGPTADGAGSAPFVRQAHASVRWACTPPPAALPRGAHARPRIAPPHHIRFMLWAPSASGPAPLGTCSPLALGLPLRALALLRGLTSTPTTASPVHPHLPSTPRARDGPARWCAVCGLSAAPSPFNQTQSAPDSTIHTPCFQPSPKAGFS
uniref:Uncharacterized protein n=1 Tax=Eutreptiella gymnastica TaxID=73025 RepID=A0A7S1NKE9_9EUGL|mmetsp:Transcript_52435/g.93604  ORF Transcript_52435/g.93604 Transcript_52435/m.93604 type:complete len:158 (+) Transcript_52435:1318-1791(+)